jgi:hypothetical protein
MPLVTIDDYIEAKLCHSIHTSQRRSFRGCRQRHQWLFEEFWYPRTTAKPLEFGSAYHVGLETYFNPLFWDKPREVVLELAIQAFRQECEDQLKSYYRATGMEEGTELDPEVEADYKERKELGKGMLRYFHAKIRDEPKLHHMRPIKVEIPFEFPIESPTGEQMWCKCKTCWHRFKESTHVTSTINSQMTYQACACEELEGEDWWESFYDEHWKGLPVTYGGRIDAIFEHADGRIWIVDWKTAARLASEQDRTEFLSLDDQILSYCAALWKLGIRVAGFLYFEQKKVAPVEPEPLVRRRLGRMFSVSKQNTYDPDVYEKTVSEIDPEAYEEGLYDDFIDYLRTEGGRFHSVYKEYRTEEQMRIALEDIYNEACDILDPNLRIYKNAGRFNCGMCAFRQPCLEKSSGGDYQYALETMFEKRQYHYWEQKKPSTDSKGGE